MDKRQNPVEVLYLGYIPEVTPPAVFTALFAILFVIHLAYFIKYWRMLFWVWILLGLAGETAGFIVRLLMHYSPYSFGLFLAQIFCLVLSPVFFAGVNYILFSRIARKRMQVNSRSFRCISYAFIASDIITLFIQTAGGSLFSSSDYNVVRTGGKVLIAGLSVQLFSLATFCIWMALVDYRIMKERKNLDDRYEREWNRIQIARWISITGILIRAIYRILEYAQGENGFLLMHEVFLYCFDSLPIFIATAVFVVPGFFPGRLLTMDIQTHDSLELNVGVSKEDEQTS